MQSPATSKSCDKNECSPRPRASSRPLRPGLREADVPRLLGVQGLAPRAHDVPVLPHEVALEALQVVRADLTAELIRKSGLLSAFWITETL